MADASVQRGWRVLRRWPDESPSRAIVVTLLVCTVCSALIATTVTLLQPYRERNQSAQRDQHVRDVIGAVPGLADLLGPLGSARVETRLIDLANGNPVASTDQAPFDERAAARNPETSVALPGERDLAGLGRRANRATVFLVYEGERLQLLVLPVSGAGYISTLYGFLALDADLNTIRGLTFYEHAETPGLGSEIDNPRWREQWAGKALRDRTGRLRIEVARGRAAESASDAEFQVDGISGATRTGVGVTNLVRFWVGPDGFGPYLTRLREARETP